MPRLGGVRAVKSVYCNAWPYRDAAPKIYSALVFAYVASYSYRWIMDMMGHGNRVQGARSKER